jgi:hypothetical protein
VRVVDVTPTKIEADEGARAIGPGMFMFECNDVRSDVFFELLNFEIGLIPFWQLRQNN